MFARDDVKDPAPLRLVRSVGPWRHRGCRRRRLIDDLVAKRHAFVAYEDPRPGYKPPHLVLGLAAERTAALDALRHGKSLGGCARIAPWPGERACNPG